MRSRQLTFVEAINEALREEMERDPTIFCLGEDIEDPFGGAYKVTRGLSDRFGRERVRNTPISEAAIVGTALGAAITGMRPVAELMYMDFMAVAFDQILNQVAKIRYMLGGQVTVPLVIRGHQGSGVGNAAQHSQSLETYFFHTPGLIVVQPSNAYDAKGLLKTALRQDDPVIFLEHQVLYNVRAHVPEEEYLIPFGQAAVRREGKDLTVVATGIMVNRALEAAETLAGDGLDVEVVDPRTLFPLDVDTLLSSVRKTGRCLIVHEAVQRGGIGAELAALISEQAFDDLDGPVERLGGLDIPIPCAPELERAAVPQAEDIVKTARRMFRLGGGAR